MNDAKYVLRFVGVLGSLFIMLLIGMYFIGVFLSNKYPMLETSDSLKDTVSSIISDGRGSARITSTSTRRFTLPWAKRIENGEVKSLPRMVQEGDILLKKQASDTIFLIQGETRYLFIAHKTIE